jgi:hypothetical protein
MTVATPGSLIASVRSRIASSVLLAAVRQRVQVGQQLFALAVDELRLEAVSPTSYVRYYALFALAMRSYRGVDFAACGLPPLPRTRLPTRKTCAKNSQKGRDISLAPAAKWRAFA